MTTAAIGTVELGRCALEVGDPSGAVVSRLDRPAGEDVGPLVRALDGQEEDRESGESLPAAVGDAAERASEVTAEVERAATLSRGLADGTIDLTDASTGADALLAVLERLDREERWGDALRLARALSTLLSLLRRWESLLSTLGAALRSAERSGSLAGIGWAKHEFGALQVAAGEVKGAERNLGRAREIRERLGDRAGLAATERNLGALCERMREMVREDELVPRSDAPSAFPRRWLVPAILVGLLLLFAGGVAGSALDGGAGGGEGEGGGNGDGGGGSGEGTGGGDGGSGGNGGGGGEEQATLRVTLAGEGSGAVASERAGIECGEDCEADFPVGEEVALTASPAEDSRFAGFSGDCSDTGERTCTLSLGAAGQVTATFEPAEYTLEVAIEGEGAGSISSSATGIGCSKGDGEARAGCGSARIPAGESVLLTADPDEFATVARFSGTDAECPGEECTVTMDRDRSVTVTLAQEAPPVP